MNRPDQPTRRAVTRELIPQEFSVEEVMAMGDWQTYRSPVQQYLYHGPRLNDRPSSSQEEKKEGEEARRDGTREPQPNRHSVGTTGMGTQSTQMGTMDGENTTEHDIAAASEEHT
jgi:DNA replication initiation complex subunit (GINS family)